jgi:hypothetical protein
VPGRHGGAGGQCWCFRLYTSITCMHTYKHYIQTYLRWRLYTSATCLYFLHISFFHNPNYFGQYWNQD